MSDTLVSFALWYFSSFVYHFSPGQAKNDRQTVKTRDMRNLQSAIALISRPQVLGQEGLNMRHLPVGARVVGAARVGVDLLWAVERIVERIAGLRRADIVAQADIEQHRAANTRREVDPIEVVQRRPHIGSPLRIEPQ